MLSVVDFTNNQQEPIYFKDNASGDPVKVNIRIPAPGANSGDMVSVYYSHEGITWIKSIPTNVIDIGGQPYVSIASDHLTLFAIAAET